MVWLLQGFFNAPQGYKDPKGTDGVDYKPLEAAIYKFLVTQLRNDYQNLCNGSVNHISLLAKWLPREGSSLDKAVNFVSNMYGTMGFISDEVYISLRVRLRPNKPKFGLLQRRS